MNKYFNLLAINRAIVDLPEHGMPIKNILIDEHSKEVRVLVYTYRAKEHDLVQYIARDNHNTSTPTRIERRKRQ